MAGNIVQQLVEAVGSAAMVVVARGADMVVVVRNDSDEARDTPEAGAEAPPAPAGQDKPDQRQRPKLIR